CSVTAIILLEPANASSAALSITSCRICRGLSVRVYMPGRWRTGSSPLSTWIDASSYRELVNFAPLPELLKRLFYVVRRFGGKQVDKPRRCPSLNGRWQLAIPRLKY